MNSFIQYILHILSQSMGFLILGGILAAVGITIAYFVFQKKYQGARKFPWGKILLILLLAGYLLIVVYATLFRNAGGIYRGEYNLHLFRAWREAWNNFSVKNWANVLLNVAMFVPLGVLLPLLWKGSRKWYVMVPIGFGVSLGIELVQLALGRGVCDADDLFANTLGAALGYLCVMAVRSLFRKNGKQCLLYGTLALIPIVAVGGIFAAYHWQEYGNLPDAPAYTNNTKGITWTLNCELPAEENTAAVYRTKTKTPAQCDIFAEEIAKTAGLTVDLASYYQEYAYYNLQPGGLLLVNYYDGSFAFRAGSRTEVNWAEADRVAVEQALSAYPVSIPEQAEFCYEGDGWHSFTVHRHLDGAMLFDGTLRVRYGDTGKAYEVENNLCAYTYYGEVTIISPEDAYQALQKGRFQDEGYLEYAKPQAVAVTQCTLDYRVDTKGFYQPVYRFTLESPDNSYACDVIIPAMQ